MKNQDRRNFLKTGTVVGTSVLASSLMSLTPSEAQASPGNNTTKPGATNKTRTLGSGKHSIDVAYGLGLGCMGMSWNRSFIPNKKEIIAVIRRAYDMGVNLFDTAEAYGPFRNEELVGEAIAPFRNKITLCSKFGFDIQTGKLTGGFNSKPRHIKEVTKTAQDRPD